MPDWPPRSATFVSRCSDGYVLQGGGPPPPSDEVEYRALLAIEVVVLWRGDVLRVSHLRLPGTFFVGGSTSCCDVSLPAELLGAERLCVAIGSRTELFAVLPPHASGWLTLADGSRRAFEESSPLGLTEERLTSSERLLSLGGGCRAHLCFKDIEIQVAPVQAGRAPLRRRDIGFQASTLAYFGLSSLSVGGLLAVFSLMAPPLGLNRDERVEADRLYLVQRYLTASAERATERREEAGAEPSRASVAARPSYARRDSLPDVLATESGVTESDGRSSSDLPQLEPALDAVPAAAVERRTQLEDARGFGMMALLGDGSMWAWVKDSQFMFKRELGGAEVALMQTILEAAGDPMISEGPGGLALSGIGLGSGGRADVIALDAVRTASAGEGVLPERFAQVGQTGSYRPHPPRIRHGEGLVSGQLPAATIRRTVNGNFAKLRACYEGALASAPTLAGSVRVSFAVLRDGQVDYVSTAGSDLPSEGVLECIERAFYGFRFSNPSSSPVNVTYPFQLSPRGLTPAP